MNRIFLILATILFFSCKKTPEKVGAENPGPEASKSVMDFLPKKVAFGQENDISQLQSMITESDYRYHYLTGDIFTDGWASWNAPKGEYARIFLNQSAQAGKIPVFTYYTIVAAKNRYQDPAFQNLNDAEVMRKYFEDWKLLLDICKQYGKTVIIHYEPDMLGYLQIYKNDPSKNSVKVALSNFPDASGYSNDTKGLYQLIVAMRNKYAPNALLGWHVSQWATGKDLIRGKENPELLATETIDFYKSLQAPFDLIFCEFSDRDAGFYEKVQNDPGAWWSLQGNASNGNLSDFDRFLRYLKKMNVASNQKIILWQIPIGNTLTKTCNNTLGHYKDNRPEYFLEPVLQSGNVDRIRAYGDAGVIALLFGAGAGECTSYLDNRGDGITGSGETADDDGGYLRKGIKAYYQKGPVKVN